MTQSIQRELRQYFQGQLWEFKTPLALIGSPWQQRVWNELKQIPPSQTRSYAALAKLLEASAAHRAVANANAANQLAIVIPCHRVINSNGELGGYGGGLARKKWLLAHEKKALQHMDSKSQG